MALVRCCHVGVTCFIDPTGRVTRMLEGSDRPEGVQGTVSAAVPVHSRGGSTVYVRVGDLFVLAATTSLLALLAASVRARARARSGRRRCPDDAGNENRTKCS